MAAYSGGTDMKVLAFFANRPNMIERGLMLITQEFVLGGRVLKLLIQPRERLP